jgi:hypothetical protein
MNLRGNEQFLKKALYPCVRVRTGKAGGSGQVIHSSEQNGTFVLSCHHVVDDAIQIKDQWSSILQKTVKRDIFSPVQIDFFKYSYKDRVTGSESKTAQIIVYDKEEDIALLRVDDPTPYPYVAELYPCIGEDDPHLEEDLDVGSEIVTVGAPLLHDPIPTVGNLVGFKDIIDNRRYWMATGPTIFGNCLHGESLVAMADGTFKEIKDIQVGDRVISYANFGLTDDTIVEAVINSGVKQIYEVKTRNRTLRASGNHPVVKVFSVKDWMGKIRNILVWTPVEQLKTGDLIAVMPSPLYSTHERSSDSFGYSLPLVPYDLGYAEVSDIAVVGEDETYDIKLDHWHTFFANGVLVHNSGGGTYLADTWQFIGMPARIAVAAAMFSMDAITHMCYIVPITRIVKFLKDSMMDFLFDSSVTWEECKKRIEEKRKMTELEALLEQKVGR